MIVLHFVVIFANINEFETYYLKFYTEVDHP
jgi:hypothetical protein